MVVAIRLCEHISVNSTLTQILWIISKSVKIWKKLYNKKCSKFDFLSPRMFPDFYSLYSYFPVIRFDFGVYLISENPFPMVPAVSLIAGRRRCLIGRPGRRPPVTARPGIKHSLRRPTALSEAPWPLLRRYVAAPPLYFA
jgi:hypothetical protein